jgi:predicted enzyme related to lactoylglutathione lyase
MRVTRIIANLSAPDPTALAGFYQRVFGLDIPYDMGWITFLASDFKQKIELHTASRGGSDTELPVISIGVEDLDAAEKLVRAEGTEIVYGPVTEKWGLRRFYFRDPAGNLINVVNS